MSEEKKVPLGWRFIQDDVERVQKGCEFEKALLELWRHNTELAKQAHIGFLYAAGQKGVEESEKRLQKCEIELVELKRQIPSMVKDWEEYWKKPFPLIELKKKVEGWEK